MESEYRYLSDDLVKIDCYDKMDVSDKKYLKAVFETILDVTESETKTKAVREAKTYIMNHWKN